MNKLKNVWLLMLLLVGFAACSDNNDDAQVVLSTGEVNLNVEGGTGTFTVQTLGDWTIETDGQTWYTVSPMQGSGATEVTVKAEASTQVASRSANLTVRCGSSSAVLAITQIGTSNPADPANQDILIRAKGGDKEVVLPANEGYDVVIPSDASWLGVKEKKEGSVVLTATANEGGDQYRTAEVIVNAADGSKLATLNVSQSWRNVEPGELLIEEIFLTGNIVEATGRPDTKNLEQYFILTNNTDEELEIGGIAIAESEISTDGTTMTGMTWDPDRRGEVAALNYVMLIPGDKGRHTLAARESLLIASRAQNYKATNPNSFDLSGADYEWYTQNTSTGQGVDNPDVPNMDVWIGTPSGLIIFNTQMNKGYFLATLPSGLTMDEYVDSPDYLWTGTRSYKVASTGKDFTLDFNAMFFPNEWVLDAVVVGTTDGFTYNPFCDALDAGYTYCAANTKDETRYGKAMRRKSVDGVLTDTNNSTNDFEHGVKASLAE